MRDFVITLKDLSKYNNTGTRTVVVKGNTEGEAIMTATSHFKGYDLVGFKELGVSETVAEETPEDASEEAAG